MDELNQLEVTPRQKAAGNICAGTAIILAGIFLLLCGLNVIPLNILDVIAASILFAIAAAFLTSGLIQRNPVSVWIAVAFSVPALVEVLEKFTQATYGGLYPLYIAIPAVASLITSLIFRSFRPHIPVIVFFGGLAALFALQSSGLGWAIAAPAVVVFAGLCILYVAIKGYRNKGDDGIAREEVENKDEEQAASE